MQIEPSIHASMPQAQVVSLLWRALRMAFTRIDVVYQKLGDANLYNVVVHAELQAALAELDALKTLMRRTPPRNLPGIKAEVRT